MNTAKFRFHFLGMPHTTTSEEYCHCAYTAKVYKAIKMLSRRGHSCIDYSNEGSTAKCERVQIFTEQERAAYFGPHDKQKLYHIVWDGSLQYWREYNARLVAALIPRVKKGDFILTLSGVCQVGQVGAFFPGSYEGTLQSAAIVEWGIGYYGPQSRYRVFESHGHREWLMGMKDVKWEDNDTAVVHNFFDMDEFPVEPQVPLRVAQAINDKPYYLFIGRIMNSKGVDIAVEVCKTLGARLIVAGQGDYVTMDKNIIFFGHANVEERAALMHNAIAVLNPTKFREPFGGTAVEAQLSSTPAITTDHGAFLETVEEEWRCASHREFVDAAKMAAELTIEDRQWIRDRARSKWSLEAIAPRYERYFQRIMDRWGKGWYQEVAHGAPLKTPLDTILELPPPPGEPHFSSHHMAKSIFDGLEYDPQVLIEGVQSVLDIGANVGAFAVWAKYKWPNATIDCYEPNPDVAAYCKRNAPFANVNERAVTTQGSPTILWIDPTWGGSRTFEPPAEGKRIIVKTIHPNKLPKADILKIDAEGVEVEVLGNYPYLKEVKLCTYEYHRADHRDKLRSICREANLRPVNQVNHSPEMGVDIWLGIGQ
jgi:FkbM family methyltransferase